MANLTDVILKWNLKKYDFCLWIHKYEDSSFNYKNILICLDITNSFR